MPRSFELALFTAYTGKFPDEQREIMGDHDLLRNELTGWIATRNGVAHHCLPQQVAKNHPVWRSDADGSDGLTVQAGGARACTALMIQLVDQTIRAVAAVSRYNLGRTELLPDAWFSASPPRELRGITEPGSLWGGKPLARPVL
ncbi:hypothetical protein [Nocardia carnea]|uniref:hypothetical protein n=1 Tax=Nocardia carnea TaxID=37328 RepID=UPI002457C430|nr:hypothetical protein [Nocardia carnea]